MLLYLMLYDMTRETRHASNVSHPVRAEETPAMTLVGDMCLGMPRFILVNEFAR